MGVSNPGARRSVCYPSMIKTQIFVELRHNSLTTPERLILESEVEPSAEGDL